jgi:GT2 family glycosyltransferase
MNTTPRLSAADVAVVIVHFGEREVTQRAIESVGLLNPPPGKIYVVNNGPGAWPSEESSPDVEILNRADNSGYAGAVNTGARAAIASGLAFVWVLNNDVEVDPSSLSHFVEAYSQDPNLEILGSYVVAGDVCWFGGGDFAQRTGRASHVGYGLPLDSKQDPGCTTTDWINGCSMFIPVTSFATRGWFDEFFFLYKEELEWQLRLPQVRAGMIRRPLVNHLVGASTGSSDGRLGQVFMSRNGLILALRQRGMRRAGWLSAWIFDFMFRPLLRFRWSVLRDHVEGATLVRVEPHEVLARL